MQHQLKIKMTFYVTLRRNATIDTTTRIAHNETLMKHNDKAAKQKM